MSQATRRQALQMGAAALLFPACTIGCNRAGSTPKTTLATKGDAMTTQPLELTVTPFLMFAGEAEKAMNLYIEVFPNSKVESIQKYGPDGDGPEGTVRLATFSLNGHKVMFIDSPVKPDFGFTPATSFYVASDDADAIEQYFNALSEGAQC